MDRSFPEAAEIEAGALKLLDELGAPRGEADHLEARTAEFVLLIVRLRELGVARPRRILEIGCGNGFSLLLWSLVADEVVGADIPEVASTARRFLSNRPETMAISVVDARGEDLSNVIGAFDLVVTQYVLEHVEDIGRTLLEIRSRLGPGGHALHVVPNMLDRTDWFVEYRSNRPVPRRLWDSVRDRGIGRTLRRPLAHVPPHSPEFGTYSDERREYRLERWVARLLRAGFEIVDFFPTRDVNWTVLTRVRRSGL